MGIVAFYRFLAPLLMTLQERTDKKVQNKKELFLNSVEAMKMVFRNNTREEVPQCITTEGRCENILTLESFSSALFRFINIPMDEQLRTRTAPLG